MFNQKQFDRQFSFMQWAVFAGFLVVIGLMIAKGMVYFRDSTECRKAGGIMVDDSAGMPTCIKGDKVLVVPTYRN